MLMQEDLLPTTNELGIGILAYSPLGRGMLTSSIKSPTDLAAGDIRKTLPRFKQGAFQQVQSGKEPLQGFSKCSLLSSRSTTNNDDYAEHPGMQNPCML